MSRGGAFALALSAWCLGFGIGAGASWWAIALGAFGVVVAIASALIQRQKKPDPEVVEVTTRAARKVLHGPIKVRVVTTTMRDVEGSRR